MIIRVKIDCSPDLDRNTLLECLVELMDDLCIGYNSIYVSDDKGNEVSQEHPTEPFDPFSFDRTEEKEEV